MERACITSSLTTKFDEDDDDDLSEDFLRLEEYERLIKEEISRIDVFKSETNIQKTKRNH